MAMSYSQYVDAVAHIAATDASDRNFASIVPAMIDYAELRIYRDLNLLSTRVANESSALTANSRTFTLPTDTRGNWITVTGVNIISPAGATTANGERHALPSLTRNLVDFIADTETAPTTPSLPRMYYMRNDQTVIVGPAPDAAYHVEIIGTIRPTSLSQSNTTTWMSTYLPDLLIAASMIFYSGFMRNFGSQSDNPAQAVSWEQQYGVLLQSANAEETRRRFNADMGSS